ncbi:MAG: hybrid sensor histidine kinase/response regulator [Xenococcaceae cyanobacterium MO_188.B29]|nr:hybrid sensor histidine kinase/response regulator [Xenococcaceae cyanobacterium MO_188.B29]
MDTEQQIHLDFLDEAQEYLDRMESNLLGLADTVINPQQVDIVLRAAHCIKGGAAMMGFDSLSRVAHRLEDFLKILRVRYASSQITTEVETLLLQSVDCLRTLSELNRQGLEITDSDLGERAESIFGQLREYLGDLEDTDEDALMAQDEDVDPALLIFEEGVDTVLDRFESQLKDIGIGELAQELATTAQELISFGKMANLESFTQLCESIQQQAETLSNQEIELLTDRALKTWRRSHALVLRGKVDKLPSDLEVDNSANQDPDINATLNPLEDSSLELSGLQSAFEIADSELPLEADVDTLEDSSLELSGLQSAFEIADSELPLEADVDTLEDSSLELSELQSAFEIADSELPLEADVDALEDSSLELSELQSAFEIAESELPLEADVDALEDSSLELSELESAVDVDNTEEQQTIIQPTTKDFFPSTSPQKIPSIDKMVRVPASQLKQFNNLFEQLILDRNTINLRLQQLQNAVVLMGQRISQIEGSNTQLRQWYDRASVEGLITNQEQLLANSVSFLTSNRVIGRADTQSDRFDSLEMDRYSDVHLICQEQIETIVQLQEVATDIELGLQEINQAVRNLNYTTKSMQGNVTRTQMLPFAEVVKRFPRVIRDLNLQFNKQVNLKIVGKNILLDRSIIEALGDPLMHLLRNAFDHGIEDPQTRIAAGKSPSGTITIQANNQGTYTVITLSDDGGGISIDKIRDRVVQMGIPSSEVTKIPEAELLNFIFEPGFSTAQKVTELSGRGVGMDVVKTNLQEIRGDVRVATELGQGTTFTLRVPFTLSILRVAVIEQAGIIFAIPANSILELVPLTSELITTSTHTKNILWNQKEIPLVEIEKTLVYRHSHHNVDLTGNPVIDRTMAIVVGDEKFFAALQISHFWYEQESTIRTIDSPILLPSGVISSVVFGDGKVLPLVDPLSLIEECLSNYSSNHQSHQNLTETKNRSITTTILVVDDSINVRRYLSLTLEKAGYRVEQAKDGREAVDKLLSGLSVQAVICDIEMPRLDGYGVLEEIKERAEFAQLPIAMLTSRSNEKHRKLAMNLGASAYFSKPYNEQELLDKLAELLHGN